MDDGDTYDLDEIAERSGLDRMKLLSRLIELELAGARAANRGRPIRTISWTMLRYSKGSHG